MPKLSPDLTRIPEALHAGLCRHWEQLTDSARRRDVTLPEDRRRLNELAQVLASSEFVARSLTQRPELLTELDADGSLDRPIEPREIASQVVRQLADCHDETALGTALRRCRQREMVRIAWRDLAGGATPEEILGSLSALADSLLEQALTQLHDWHCQRYGRPRDDHGKTQQLVILGLGKLGGGELNFSSDIDLMFAYPAAGQTDSDRPVSNETFFRRLGQRLIGLLAEPTADGFVFRVDMRLRPFGEAGPLASSFSALEEYYQNHGRNWERYALIKARIVAGDRTAGELLLASLRPFVYRRYLDYGAIDALRRMKTLITREVERKGLRHNLKLGPGGIREIEFIGQAFQLIYGGREPELRQRAILPVLDHLAASGRLPADAVTALKQAYRLFRRAENRLQEWADQQTHDLPTEAMARACLAYAMGYTDWPALAADLRHHNTQVSQQFALIFEAPQSEQNPHTDIAALWNDSLSEERALVVLSEHGFDSPQPVLHSLQRLRASFSFRALSATGRARLAQLLPLLLAAVGQTDQAAVTLERLLQLLEAVLRRSVYLALLVENPLALSQLVQLCAASPWIAHYLTRYPLLLDDLLNPANLYQPLDRNLLRQTLERHLARVPSGDTEQQLDALRHFQQSNVLRVAAADISGVMPLMVVSDHLTELAEVLLDRVRLLAWDNLCDRYGQPCHRDSSGALHHAGLAIIGYGKLGGIELGYGSDLDLVFLHDSEGQAQTTDGTRGLDNASFFAKLVQRIIHLLSTRTAAGILYDVDTRLRPSGQSGLLVSSLKAFADYQRQQAWTWEHQALVRARCVTGPAPLAQRFAELRRDILCQPREPSALRQAVADMRERMRRELDHSDAEQIDVKQGPGAIVDIEFLVQYLVLAHAHKHPELVRYSDNIRQLDALEASALLNTADAELLRDTYRTLRRLGHRLRLQESPARMPITELALERRTIGLLWQRLLGPAA